MFLELIIWGEKSQIFKLNSRTLISFGLIILLSKGTSTSIIFQSHRIAKAGKDLRLSPTINLVALRLPLHDILCATSTCLLSTFRDGDSTTSMGKLFQCLTTLS